MSPDFDARNPEVEALIAGRVHQLLALRVRLRPGIPRQGAYPDTEPWERSHVGRLSNAREAAKRLGFCAEEAVDADSGVIRWTTSA